MTEFEVNSFSIHYGFVRISLEVKSNLADILTTFADSDSLPGDMTVD